MPDTKGEGEIVSFRAEVAVSASSEGLPDLAVSCRRQRGRGSTCKTRPRQADTNPARPLTYCSVSLCWGLHSARHSLRVMKQFLNKTGKKLHLKECTFSDFLSRPLAGQALLEVLGVLLGAEPSLHTRRAHLPVVWEPGITLCTHGGGSWESSRSSCEVTRLAGHSELRWVCSYRRAADSQHPCHRTFVCLDFGLLLRSPVQLLYGGKMQNWNPLLEVSCLPHDWPVCYEEGLRPTRRDMSDDRPAMSSLCSKPRLCRELTALQDASDSAVFPFVEDGVGVSFHTSFKIRCEWGNTGGARWPYLTRCLAAAAHLVGITCVATSGRSSVSQWPGDQVSGDVLLERPLDGGAARLSALSAAGRGCCMVESPFF